MKPSIDTPADLAWVHARAILSWVAQQRSLAPELRRHWMDVSASDRFTVLRQAAKELGYAV